MAKSGDMKFSVVLEAITAAFNKGITEAHTNLSAFKAEAGAPAADLGKATEEARGRINALRSELNETAPAADVASESFTSLGRAALATAAGAVSLAAIKSGIEAILEVIKKFDAVIKQLEYVTGSSKQAGEEFEFVRGISKRMGLELLSSADSYAKLSSATKDTALEGKATRDVFEGVAAAAASLGLSVDDTNGVMLAISQIASKGVVSMEELRGQLGERLPPAMGIAAKSMGVTVAELGKLVDSGLDSVTFLEAFGPAMIEAFSPTASQNVNSLSGSITGMKNELTNLMLKLGKGGVGQAAKMASDDVAGVFRQVQEALSKVQTAMDGLDPATVEALSSTFDRLRGIVATTFGTLISLAGDAYYLIESVASAIENFVQAAIGVDVATDHVGLFTRAMQGISVILGTIQDGISGFGILVSLATMDIQRFLSITALGLSKLTFGDASKSLLKFSTDMEVAANASFGRAQEKALSFESAAVAALERTAVAGVKSGETVSAAATDAARGVVTAYTSAADAAKAALEETERKAKIAASSMTLTGLEGVKVMLSVSQTGNEVADSFKGIAKAVGMTIPPSVRMVADLGVVFGEVATRSKTLAVDIAKNLPEALGKLNGPELKAFQDAFIGGLEKAGASADAISTALITIAEVGARTLGVELSGSLTKLSKDFQNGEVTLRSLIECFDLLKEGGVNASDLIEKALAGMLEKARNPVEIDHLVVLYKQMALEGKIGADALAQGLVDAKNKADAMLPGINSLAEAFKTFGMQSREEATLTAARYKEAFLAMKMSGQATTGELQTAFTAYAEQAVKANKGVVDAQISGQAATLGLKVAIDETGKAVVTRMADSSKAVDGLTTAVGGTTAAVEKNMDAMDRLMMKYTMSAEYSANQVRLLNDEAAATQALIDLENKRRGVDKDGFSTDKDGKRIDMGGDLTTRTGVLNFLRAAGVSDEQKAKEITNEFADNLGNIAYVGNKGQMKYGGSGSTISQALLKAAERYTFSDAAMKAPGAIAANATASASGTSTNSTVITFKTAAGKDSSVITSQGTTVEDVIASLRAAGASSITRG